MVILYLVGAYAVLQFVDTILVSALEFPSWLLPLLVVVSAVGFPIVVVLAWALQVTTEGVRADRGRGFSELLGVGGRVLAVLLVVLLSVALGVTGWQVWGPRTSEAASAGNAAAVIAPVSLDPARVAVLYFDDYTPNGEYAYLADALTEALIHELGQVRSLDVISRNGVKRFRGERVDMDRVVAELRAGSIVEGSVAPGPDGKIRVTFQLIRGSDLSHLHSDYVDAPVGAWIALQDSLVGGVSRALRKVLGRELDLRRRRAGNTSDEAWALWGRAQRLYTDFWALRSEDAEAGLPLLLRADTLLAKAGHLDPTWDQPALLRGHVALDLASIVGSPTAPSPTWCTQALAHAERALAVSVDTAAALELRGLVRMAQATGASGSELASLRSRAEADLRLAVERDDRSARAWQALSELLTDQGRFEEAKLAADHAIAADEFLDLEENALFAAAYSGLQFGPDDAIITQVAEGRSRFPDNSGFIQLDLTVLGTFPQVAPDVDRAWALVDSLVATVPSSQRQPYRAWAIMQVAKVAARAGLADSARAIVIRARGPEPQPGLAYDEAQVALLMDDRASAVRLLRMALAVQLPDTAVVARDWVFDGLHTDPAFLRLVGLGTETASTTPSPPRE